jgi:hypothetical protein
VQIVAGSSRQSDEQVCTLPLTMLCPKQGASAEDTHVSRWSRDTLQCLAAFLPPDLPSFYALVSAVSHEETAAVVPCRPVRMPKNFTGRLRPLHMPAQQVVDHNRFSAYIANSILRQR